MITARGRLGGRWAAFLSTLLLRPWAIGEPGCQRCLGHREHETVGNGRRGVHTRIGSDVARNKVHALWPGCYRAAVDVDE